jgi:hypothetical protein
VGQLLQSGQADVVVLSFDALGRTKMNEEAVVEYVEEVEAVRARSPAPAGAAGAGQREGRRQAQRARQGPARARRQAAWVEETLKLPKGWTYDPGIAWDDIGIDMLVVDEAAALQEPAHAAGPRGRRAQVHGFGGGEGSHRAWQLDFRAAAVRRAPAAPASSCSPRRPRRTARSSSTT